MAESLRSWLWAFASSQAGEALQGGYDLRDMPFVSGNRVQILRFMTFARPDDTAGIWALVGDKTHCIAVLFHPKAVDAFERRHKMTLTSLKGALITLSQIKLTVDRIRTHNEVEDGVQPPHNRGFIYRHLQLSMLLEIGGFQVVSSVGEPIWHTQIHAVTSKAGLAEDDLAKRELMMQWMKQWIRAASLARNAALEHARLVATPAAASSSNSSSNSIGDDSTRFPTPGQRKGAVRTLPIQLSTSPVAQDTRKRSSTDSVPESKRLKPTLDELLRDEEQSSSPSIFARVYGAIAKSISSTPPSPIKSAPTVDLISPEPVPAPKPLVIVLSPTIAPAQAQAPRPPKKKKKSTLTASQKQAKRDKAIADLMASIVD